MDRRDKLCGIAGVIAVVVYALACRPSWSPDSRQVAYYFHNEETEVGGVALYDLELKQGRRLYEQKTDSAGFMQVVCLPSGKSILAVQSGKKKVEFLRIDPKDGGASSIKTIVRDGYEGIAMYPLVVGEERYLWTYWTEKREQQDGDKDIHGLLKVDCVTGKAEFVKTGALIYLSQNGDACAYLGVSETEEALEVGRFDPVTGTRQTIASFTEKEFPGEPSCMFVAIDSAGSRIAMAAKKDDLVRILVVGAQGRIIREVACSDTVSEPSYVTWGQDSHTVWLSTELRAEEKAKKCSGLVEVDIEKASARVYPVDGARGDATGLLQPSLSPDKKWLAAMALPGDNDGMSELILVDLTTPERKMTRIATPPAKASLQR